MVCADTSMTYRGGVGERNRTNIDLRNRASVHATISDKFIHEFESYRYRNSNKYEYEVKGPLVILHDCRIIAQNIASKISHVGLHSI